MMAALQGATVSAAPISEATGRLNTVPDSLCKVAEVLFAQVSLVQPTGLIPPPRSPDAYRRVETIKRLLASLDL
jgi:hypothetical protein